MLRRRFALSTLVSAVLGAFPGLTMAGESKPSYALVLEGKKCETSTFDQSLSCEYMVGTGLKFTIAGIGQPDTAITFLKSSFDGDFYASVGLLHGCVIVKRGTTGVETDVALETSDFLDFAFVSPKNGKVYKSWEQCKAAW